MGGAQDFTGDGRADLIARRSDGLLFRYTQRADGSFAAAVQIGGGWNIYTAIMASPDLNGDRLADVIARDAAGRLWRYNGTGGGGLHNNRTQIGGGWNVHTAIS